MKKLDKPGVETLLQQLQLSQPPTRLDNSIGELFGKETPAFQPASRIGYRELCGVAMVALLLGGLVGFMAASKANTTGFRGVLVADTDLPSSFTPVVFNKLHGHSKSPSFSDCSACHKFPTKAEQELEKWQFEWFHDSEVREQLGVPDCSNCHVHQKAELGADPHSRD